MEKTVNDSIRHPTAENSSAIFSGTRTIRGNSSQPIPVGENCSTNPDSIRTIKQGDEISAIEVRCSCGQILRINCDYT